MLRAYAILLVFIGHSIQYTSVKHYLYSFHVPLFFWISGYCFNAEKYRELKGFVKTRFRTVVIPYLIFAVVSFAFWFTVVRALSVRGQVHSIDPLWPFVGIFYGIGIGEWRNPLDNALWFLPCLFVTEVLFWILNRHAKGVYRLGVVVLFGLSGYLMSIWMPFRLPWSIDVGFTAVVFYALGNIAKQRNELLFAGKWATLLVYLIGIAGFVGAIINGKADMNYNKLNNPFLFYIAAFAGIYFWNYIFHLIPLSRLLSYIGRNTIILVGLSGFA
jgi:fucose 4-O-acetylase-like acetyltransferase